MQVDTFGAYVKAELEHWGREFALHRDQACMGNHSKHVLQVLIEQKGDLNRKAHGYKTIELDHRAQLIEDIVARISRDNLMMACSLRAYYCGRGRKKVERFETAIRMMASCDVRPVSNRQYLSLVELGFQRIRGIFEGMGPYLG